MKIEVHQVTAPMMLKHVLLIYENGHEKTIQRGVVEIENERAVITKTEEITESLREMLTKEKYSPLTFIPEPVVGVTKHACAWFVPAQPRPLFFSPTRDTALHELSGLHFPQPPLLMISRQYGNLEMYALKENARPGLNTPLMNAPYYNVYDQDNVCLGNAYRPFDGTIEHLHEWEATFYGSHFTHRAGSKTRWTNDRTHRELWEGAADAGHFDPEWLIPSGKTLQSVLGRTQ